MSNFFDCNHMLRFNSFGDITTYWSKMCYHRFTYPGLVWSTRNFARVSPGTWGMNVDVKTTIKLRDLTVNQRVTDRRTDVGRSYHYWLWRIYSACVWKDTTFQNIHFYCVHTFNLLLEVFRPRNDLWCVEWDVKLYYTIWKFLSCFRILLYTKLLSFRKLRLIDDGDDYDDGDDLILS